MRRACRTRASGRDRPLVHVPLGLVRYGLAGLRRPGGLDQNVALSL
jgi:hypothetical protein